jgi:hypothetical protein
MQRRTLLLALAALPAVLAANAGAEQPRNRIVFQVNEDDGRKWLSILVNIRNIQAELGKGHSAIALVAIGPGLGMLKADAVVANEVQDAIKAGVEFIACGNSMQAQHLDREDLTDGVGVVKAGYVELMKRQQLGWAYLRP